MYIGAFLFSSFVGLDMYIYYILTNYITVILTFFEKIENTEAKIMPNLNLSYIYRRHFAFLIFDAFNPLKFQRMLKGAKNLVFF